MGATTKLILSKNSDVEMKINRRKKILFAKSQNVRTLLGISKVPAIAYDVSLYLNI